MIKYDISSDIFGDNSKTSKINLFSSASSMTTNDRVYTLDVNFREFNDRPINTGIKFIYGDRNTSIIKAKMLMDKDLIDLNGITVTVNLNEGETGYDIYTIVCDDIDVENSLVTVNLEPYTVDLVGVNTFEFVLTKGEKV